MTLLIQSLLYLETIVLVVCRSVYIFELVAVLQFDVVWYSDDGGRSYQLSESVLEKMDEAQLVEVGGGMVMANMRNNHLSSCDCRAVAISMDGGKTFGTISFDPTLISPVSLHTVATIVTNFVVVGQFISQLYM